ncbi:MFS transporter [Peribacillus sp. SI8-4]|uniref:MFS transporter n=1 Tax=Peribacillus sp. SI8-4 TaxID=3048009 RepID=UPI0025571DD0|nr:MFS transporter [Peribacillus sp. SI8-4]
MQVFHPFKKYRPLLPEKRFSALCLSESLSTLGNMAQGIALAAYVFTLSQSIFIFGLFLIIRFAPQFLLFSIAGNIVDNYSRRFTLTIINLLLALLTCTMAFNSDSTTIILVITLLIGIIELPYHPALSSSIPALVKKDQLGLANGLIGIVTSIARVIGSAIAAFGLLNDTIIGLLMFNAITFFIAGVITWTKLPTANLDSDASHADDAEGKSTHKENGWMMSVAYLKEHNVLKNLIFGSFLIWGCLSITDVLLVPLLNSTIQDGEKYYGVYRFIAALGMLIGNYFAVPWRERYVSSKITKFGYVVPLVILSFSSIGIAFSPFILGPILYLFLWIAMFLPSNLLNVELQSTPNNMRGKVISIADALDGILFILLTGLLPYLAHFIGVKKLLIAASLPFAMISLILAYSFIRSLYIYKKNKGLGVT